MKLGKLFLTLLICAAISFKGNAQYYYYNDGYYDADVVYEFGGGVGIMNTICDVGGPNSDTKFYINEVRAKNYKLAANIYMGIMYQNFIGVKLEGTWGSVEARDQDITSSSSLNLVTKRNRNLAFRSKVNEISLMAEFHPLNLKYYDDGAPLLSPYILAGIGYFWFNPQVEIGNRRIDLQPLRTEGQGFDEYPDRQPYKLSSVNVPMGVGIRYELSPLFNIRLEYLHRILFTDYLDDASNRYYVDPNLFIKYLSVKDAAYAKALSNPSKNGKVPARRGNPDDNDTYMSINLKFGIVLGRQPRY